MDAPGRSVSKRAHALVCAPVEPQKMGGRRSGDVDCPRCASSSNTNRAAPTSERVSGVKVVGGVICNAPQTRESQWRGRLA
jgi:hypothetical protein